MCPPPGVSTKKIVFQVVCKFLTKRERSWFRSVRLKVGSAPKIRNRHFNFTVHFALQGVRPITIAESG